MRRIRRGELATAASTYLNRQQTSIDRVIRRGTLDVKTAWAAAAGSKLMAAVRGALCKMAGPAERCMYCVDSHGSDIEHFWPKTPYPQHMFRWPNLLLCCTECGRFKGSRFPLQDDGEPLLLDPSIENPWDHLDFDPITGRLTARYRLELGDYSPKGVQTVQVLRLDREHLEGQYRKTYRRLCRVLDDFWEIPDGAGQDLAEVLSCADDHGLLGWWIDGIGTGDPPLAKFKKRCPKLWQECEVILSRTLSA
jgi:uncharacterized protein (TIGR02646 family)